MIFVNTGTCSKAVDIEIENDIITKCKFIGGCMGNTQGVARLVTGRDINEVIETLEGIQCGYRGTSCPDQLAQALIRYQNGATK